VIPITITCLLRTVKGWADHGVALLAGVNTPAQFSEHVQESIKLMKWVKKQLAVKKLEPADTQDFTHDLLRKGNVVVIVIVINVKYLALILKLFSLLRCYSYFHCHQYIFIVICY
jgi:hypothetical protein